MDSYVGPFRILRLINRGGQGRVYLGYDKRLHRRVAIKIYDLPGVYGARKQLLREAQLVAGLHSPKIVQVHDVIASNSHLALVMEYVPGCNLQELLQQVRPSLPSVVTVATDIAGALAIARQEGVVHGDLKAGNILIAEEGRAKLTDFGIARGRGQAQQGRYNGGSPVALAPEHYLGQPLTERADMFALGLLLYQMISGEHPFFRHGILDPELLLHHSHRPLAQVVGGEVELPPDLVTLIDDLLEKDPQQRKVTTRRVRNVMRELTRATPMSANRSLLREAQPVFRHDAPEDIPPNIPAGLARQGRSQLPSGSGRLARLWHRFAILDKPLRAVLTLALVAVVAVPLALALHNRHTLVSFGEPLMTASAPFDLPRDISREWLLGEIKTALREELGEVAVIGRVGAEPQATLYSRAAAAQLPTTPQQVFQVALRCTDALCVIAIDRQQGASRFHRQGLLFPDMSVPQWRDVVRATTRALYD